MVLQGQPRNQARNARSAPAVPWPALPSVKRSPRITAPTRPPWFNTDFYRDFGYGWIYPQLFPHRRRPDDAVHRATIAWGKERAKSWLQILNDHWPGDGRPCLCGEKITIADYFGASLLTLGEVVRCEFSAWPQRRALAWPHEAAAELAKVNEALDAFAEVVKDQKFDAA